MKGKSAILITCWCLTLMHMACKKENERAYTGTGYINNKTGHYIIYKVDSVYYNDFTSTVDSFSYFIKEKAESYFTDEEGRPTLRLERYHRANISDNWKLKDVWFTNRTLYSYEKVEENQRFMRLYFPVKENAIWDGNRYNTLGEQLYTMSNLHTTMNISGKIFDSTLTVLQVNDSNLIEKRFAEEVYASGIGLVRKRVIDVKDKDSIIDFNKPLMERITTGLIYTATYQEDGME